MDHNYHLNPLSLRERLNANDRRGVITDKELSVLARLKPIEYPPLQKKFKFDRIHARFMSLKRSKSKLSNNMMRAKARVNA